MFSTSRFVPNFDCPSNRSSLTDDLSRPSLQSFLTVRLFCLNRLTASRSSSTYRLSGLFCLSDYLVKSDWPPPGLHRLTVSPVFFDCLTVRSRSTDHPPSLHRFTVSPVFFDCPSPCLRRLKVYRSFWLSASRSSSTYRHSGLLTVRLSGLNRLTASRSSSIYHLFGLFGLFVSRVLTDCPPPGLHRLIVSLFFFFFVFCFFLLSVYPVIIDRPPPGLCRLTVSPAIFDCPSIRS